MAHQNQEKGDFPGGPVAKTPCSPIQEAWVQSLVKELDPGGFSLCGFSCGARALGHVDSRSSWGLLTMRASLVELGL